MSASRSYSFGEYRLDLARGTLLKAGADVKLRPKSFEVLRLLIERHGQLVTKDELLAAVWGHTVVTEDSIFQCLIDVRRAIGDESQQMIKTVPRRGYIFDVPVTVSDAASRDYGVTVSGIAAPEREAAGRSSAPSPPQSGPRLLRNGLLVPVDRSTPRSSIAVLPFTNLTGDAGKEYFGDGLAEELIHVLARVPGLSVAARTSSFAYKGRNADVRQIARELEVGTVLEGSVRSAGERIRVTAQLIDGETGFHLWSQHYDRRFRGPLCAAGRACDRNHRPDN